MTVTASTLLSLPIITTGTESGVWGSYVNNGLTSYLDNAIAGTVTLTNDGAVTLSNTAGTDIVTNIVSSLTGAGTVSAQFAAIRVTGTLTTAKILTAPSSSRQYVVTNAATGSTVTLKASGQTGISVAVGETATVYFNGTDYVKSSSTVITTFTGTLPVANGGTGLTSGTSGGVLYYSAAGTLASSAALTASTLLVGGGAGAAPTTTTTATGALTFLGTPTSANLAALLTDETGTGANVFATSPSITTPTLTNSTITNYVESVVAIGTVTTASTISLTSGTVQTATLTASTACTFTMPTATAGKSFILLLKQAATTGNGTATFTSVKWGTSGAPTITATAGKMDILTFVSDGTNWYGSAVQGYTP
jgi:hypothetical protein